MKLSNLYERIQGRYRATLSKFLYRRPFRMHNSVPYISFTFDDFPRSSLLNGGAILSGYGLAGTYYASLGLMGQHTPVGQIFIPEDLSALLNQGHELGCHTFGHFHPWFTKPNKFEESIIQNKRALNNILPGGSFKTFSYPLLYPRPQTKMKLGKYFVCCRYGGQKLNAGVVDRNLLQAYFLERSRENFDSVKKLVDRNIEARGWLIFATHDICKTPTPYGCTPNFFEKIVRYSLDSSASIFPVYRAWGEISAAVPHEHRKTCESNS